MIADNLLFCFFISYIFQQNIARARPTLYHWLGRGPNYHYLAMCKGMLSCVTKFLHAITLKGFFFCLLVFLAI